MAANTDSLIIAGALRQAGDGGEGTKNAKPIGITNGCTTPEELSFTFGATATSS